MNNKRSMPTLLSLAVLGFLIGGDAAHAGAFGVPTYGTPGWGRAFAGGSLWQNDPSAAYNNPAAMAFVDHPVGQVSALYADIDLRFNGQAYDYLGEPRRDITSVDLFGLPDSYRELNNGGNGGFGRALPTSFMVLPLGERWAFGLAQVVPLGMESNWGRDFVGKDFAVRTKVQTVALSGSLSFKLNEKWALGAGVLVQRTDSFVSQNVDLIAAAGAAPNSFLAGFPSGLTKAQIRTDVDNVSAGWFASVAWQPSERDRLGLSYHARIRNKLDGRYTWEFDDAENFFLTSQGIMDETYSFAGDVTLVELFYPGLRLHSEGARASSRLDVPARGTLDWVHAFNERLTVGASVTWTQWSSFQSLRLTSGSTLIVDIPYNYRDTWMYSLGGDYRLNDQLTLRAGVAYDQTPTNDSTRDAKIPDGDRTFVSLGLGYQVRSVPGLVIDAVYSRQFVEKGRLRTQNQDRLGGGRMVGEVDAKGQVFGLSATYAF